MEDSIAEIIDNRGILIEYIYRYEKKRKKTKRKKSLSQTSKFP